MNKRIAAYASVVVLLQQPLAAVIDAVIQVIMFGRPEWFLDYIHEYLIWQLRIPTRAWTDVEYVANAAALILLVVIASVAYRKGGTPS